MLQIQYFLNLSLQKYFSDLSELVSIPDISLQFVLLFSVDSYKKTLTCKLEWEGGVAMVAFAIHHTNEHKIFISLL